MEGKILKTTRGNKLAISTKEFNDFKDNLEERLNRFEAKLFGNGNPGVLIDQAKMNGNIKELYDISSSQQESIKELKQSIEAQVKLCKENDFQNVIMKNFKKLLILALGFELVMEIIVHTVPWNEIWSVIMKFI